MIVALACIRNLYRMRSRHVRQASCLACMWIKACCSTTWCASRSPRSRAFGCIRCLCCFALFSCMCVYDAVPTCVHVRSSRQEICILDALSVNSTCQTRLVPRMMRGHGRRTCLPTTFGYVHELLTMLLLRCVSLVRVRPPHLQRESREILYTRGAVLAPCSLLHDDIDAWA